MRHSCFVRAMTAQTKARLTIVGLGSILSERSARLTFPNLTDFRLGRVRGYRRVFAHTAGIFFERGIADLTTLQMASLSSEECEEASFICTIFETPNDGMEAFEKREQEFELRMVDYETLEGCPGGKALMCVCSNDEAFVAKWGQERYEQGYKVHGIPYIWGWPFDSGLRPCPTYLRHCALAAEKMGEECSASFLDETYLVDRKTTIRTYLNAHPEVMATLPPPSLAERYSG